MSNLTMNELYEINDILESLAVQYSVRRRFSSDDDYDEWLNDLTHTVADAMSPSTESHQEGVT